MVETKNLGLKCCSCCTCITMLPLLIALIVLTVSAAQLRSSDGSSTDCIRFKSCYSCVSSPCGNNNPMYLSNLTQCGDRMCLWTIDQYTNVGGCQSLKKYPDYHELEMCSVNSTVTTSKATGILITVGVFGGLALTTMTIIVACSNCRDKKDESAHLLRWKAAKNKNCGSCGHKKHHGYSCSTQVSNPNRSTCTCEHTHHKGKICNQTIHYTEYRSETKKVNVAKKRTHYRTETQRVAVVKTRMKQVDQGGYVQKPYGPGNGTYSVYEPRYVSISETYTDYENQQVNVPYYETYYVDEMQTVQVPVPKTRPCTCKGENCRCISCVPKVPCSCKKCDCSICAANGEKEEIIFKKTSIAVTIMATIGFISVVGVIFALAMGLNDDAGPAIANSFHKPMWVYNSRPVLNTAVIIGWACWGSFFVACLLSLIFLCCGDSVFSVSNARPPPYTPDVEEEEAKEENPFLI